MDPQRYGARPPLCKPEVAGSIPAGSTRVTSAIAGEGGGDFPVWSPDGNTVYYWTPFGGGDDTFLAARLHREPTPRVLSRDSLFTANYYAPASDLHPDGNQVIAGRIGVATQQDDPASNPERFIVVTNWFEELRQRMGEN